MARFRAKPEAVQSEPAAQKDEAEPVSQESEPEPERPDKPRKLGQRAILGIVAAAAILLVLMAWGTAEVIGNRNATSTALAQTTQAAMIKAKQSTSTHTAGQTRSAQTATSQAEREQNATIQAAATETASAQARIAQTATAQTVAAQTRDKNTATAQTATAQAATATAFHLATVDAVATATQAAIQTATAQPTPMPTSTPVPQGTAKQPSTIFEGPDDRTRQLGFVSVGDTLPILGRSDEQEHGRWLYVRLDETLEGFVYEPRVEYTADWASLPVVRVEITTPIPTPTPTPIGGNLIISPGPLEIVHIWPAGICNAGSGWTAWFEVKISGGDGRNYKLYWDEELVTYIVKEAEQDVAVIQRPGNRETVIGTITIESGGERKSQGTTVTKPDC